jgi:hypothetical protein
MQQEKQGELFMQDDSDNQWWTYNQWCWPGPHKCRTGQHHLVLAWLSAVPPPAPRSLRSLYPPTHPNKGRLCSSITMRNDWGGNNAVSSLHYAWWGLIPTLRLCIKPHQASFHSLAARCFGHRQVIEAVWLSCYAYASQQSHSIFTASLTMRNENPCGMSDGTGTTQPVRYITPCGGS